MALGLVALLGLAAPLPAGAQSEVSREAQRSAAAHAELARRYYKEGRFREAIEAFETAYDLDPNPSLLFNIAQAQRRQGNREGAINAFKQYLMRSPRSPQRALVETRVRELEDELARQSAPPATAAAPTPDPAATTQPTPAAVSSTPETPPPEAPAMAAAPPAADESPPPDSDELQPLETDAIIDEIERARRPAPRGDLRLLVHGGLAAPTFGGSVQPRADAFFAGLLSAAYGVPWSAGAIDVGLAASWSVLSYRSAVEPTRAAPVQHPQLLGGFVTTALRLRAGTQVALGPMVALGMVWWTGLGAANPFTQTAQGAVPMPSVRLAFPVTFRIGPVLVLGLEPAYAYSNIIDGELRRTVSSVSWFGLSGILGLQL